MVFVVEVQAKMHLAHAGIEVCLALVLKQEYYTKLTLQSKKQRMQIS